MTMCKRQPIPSGVWERINEKTNTDILSIVMDVLNGHMGEEFHNGRASATRTMELIAERCEEAYYEGCASSGCRKHDEMKTRQNCAHYKQKEGGDWCKVIESFLIPGTCPCSAWEEQG